MKEIRERIEPPATPQLSLTLPFALRQKSRLRTTLDSGEEVGLFLPRGIILRQGDLLRTTDGLVVAVKAALEPVSTATADDPLRLLKAAYHLGNRHVSLQISSGWLRYLRDPVLDHLVETLGLVVLHEMVPFEPDAGAYSHGH